MLILGCIIFPMANLRSEIFKHYFLFREYNDVFIEERSSQFESAHAAVEIRYEKGRGRYAVASRDIDMGTTLFREKALAYSLNPEKFGTNCQHCFSPIRGVVPCLNCTWVCFCSPECRTKANASYHQYECGIIKLILESGLNIYAYLALRLVTQEGILAIFSCQKYYALKSYVAIRNTGWGHEIFPLL